MERGQAVQEQPPEQAGEHPHRQEEAEAAASPSIAIGGVATAGHDAMDMRVVVEVLAPGVKHRGDADLGADVLGVGSDRSERLGRGGEQQAVDRGLVLVGHGADRRRQGEHDVKVGNRQQLGFARRQPLRCGACLALWAMAIAA